MLSYFKKSGVFFISMVLSLSIAFAVAEDTGDDFFGLFEEEDIACEDLPGAFTKYSQDTQVHQTSLTATLSGLSELLEQASEEEKIAQDEILKLIKDLKDIEGLIRGNELSLMSSSDNILYSMTGCMEELRKVKEE